MKITIYQVVNGVTGDTYIGVTRRGIAGRWRHHVYTALHGAKSKLHQAIVAHGADAFSITEIVSCLDAKVAGKLEQQVIQQWKPTYNQTNGGQFTVGKRVAREVVERIKAANTGKKRTPEQKVAMSELKKRQYATRPELRLTILDALEKARSNIDRDKQREAVAHASRNRIWSDESRKRLSEAKFALARLT